MPTKRKEKPKTDGQRRAELLERKALAAFASTSTEQRARKMLNEVLLPAYGVSYEGKPVLLRMLLSLARVIARQDVLTGMEEDCARDGVQTMTIDLGDGRGEGVHPFQKLRKDLEVSERHYSRLLGLDNTRSAASKNKGASTPLTDDQREQQDALLNAFAQAEQVEAERKAEREAKQQQ